MMDLTNPVILLSYLAMLAPIVVTLALGTWRTAIVSFLLFAALMAFAWSQTGGPLFGLVSGLVLYAVFLVAAVLVRKAIRVALRKRPSA